MQSNYEISFSQATKETFTGAFFVFSAIFFSFTIVLSIVVYLMIRGKDFVKMTAEGAGRIDSEQSKGDNVNLSKGKDNIAFIDDIYPLYNIACLGLL